MRSLVGHAVLLGTAVVLGLGLRPACAAAPPEEPSLAAVVKQVEPKIVKIYGVGGYRGLEPYQSGFLISSDGHILTAWSYVLDTEYITATLDDGRKFAAKLVAADPRLELAVLKIEAQDLPHFKLEDAAEGQTGTRVLAFSNLYGVATGNEPASVQHGWISAATELSARQGAYETPYKGAIFVLDAMTNNAGAAGGALTDRAGRLLGMLGKELRSATTNTWLNYAIPAGQMAKTVAEIRAGRFVARAPEDVAARPKDALDLNLLGIVLVPDVLDRTPPYIDAVRSGSPAAEAGLRPDDLVVFVNDRLVPSAKALRSELGYVDRIDRVRLTVTREQKLVEVTLGAPKQP